MRNHLFFPHVPAERSEGPASRTASVRAIDPAQIRRTVFRLWCNLTTTRALLAVGEGPEAFRI
jgi:hypothetical protein